MVVDRVSRVETKFVQNFGEIEQSAAELLT